MEPFCHETVEALFHRAASFVLERALAAAGKGAPFTFALSGGKTPRPLYELLASPPFSRRMPWPSVHLFWGDERCVPPDHPESNFALAHEALISRVPIPWQNVHRIPGELSPPEEAARRYEETLRRFFPLDLMQGGSFPAMDLILLGVGKDGHTASLFPGSPALDEAERWAAAVRPPPGISPGLPRITLTLRVINAARSVAFLVMGTGKGHVVRQFLDRPKDHPSSLPAGRVRPAGDLVWFMEKGGGRCRE